MPARRRFFRRRPKGKQTDHRKLMRLVKTVRSRKPEIKQVLSQDTAFTASSVALKRWYGPVITAGTGSNQRLGSKVHVRSMHIKLSFRNGTTGNFATCRFIVFRDLGYNGDNTKPTDAQLILPSANFGGTQVWGRANIGSTVATPGQPNRIHMLYDSGVITVEPVVAPTATVAQVQLPSTRTFNINLKIEHDVDYIASSSPGVDSDIGAGAICLATMSDDTNLLVGGTVFYRYTDA